MAKRFLFTLLLTATLSSIMAAQPLVQIQPNTLDVAATGVQIIALNDIGHTATVEELIGQDGAMIAKLLPYTVLVVNGSSRKLRAVTVRWTWKKSTGKPGGITLTLTAMSHADDPTQLGPGDGQLFTPIQSVNQYLGLQHRLRRGSATVVSGAGVNQAPVDYSSIIPKRLGLMDIASDVQAFLEGVVYENYSFVGSDRLFGSLQRYEPKVHR
jgi:hypothetical protein